MENLHRLAAKYFEKDHNVVSQESAEIKEQRAKARRKAGRYTFEEAAYFVQTKGRARARTILNKLLDSTASCTTLPATLAMYEPGLMRYTNQISLGRGAMSSIGLT